MTTDPTPHESRILEKVRRWRREVYEADRTNSPEQCAERVAELLRNLGLTLQPPQRRRRTRSD
jgi:hypothetical protein